MWCWFFSSAFIIAFIIQFWFLFVLAKVTINLYSTKHDGFLCGFDKDYWVRFNIFVKRTLNITTMNSKRKDLQYASVFLLAVALTFLLGKGDNFWLVSWGDLIPGLFVLFIAGDCLYSSLLRIKRGEEEGGARWSTCFTFLVFSIVFMGDLFFIGNFIVDKLWG